MVFQNVIAEIIREKMGDYPKVIIDKSTIDYLEQSLKTVCSYCLKTDKKTKRCASCQSSYYCSKECQKADYKNHKKKCYQINTLLKDYDDDTKKVVNYKRNICGLFMSHITKKDCDYLSNKEKKKKFWKFVINPVNGDYNFAPLRHTEKDRVIELFNNPLNLDNKFCGVFYDVENSMVLLSDY